MSTFLEHCGDTILNTLYPKLFKDYEIGDLIFFNKDLNCHFKVIDRKPIKGYCFHGDTFNVYTLDCLKTICSKDNSVEYFTSAADKNDIWWLNYIPLEKICYDGCLTITLYSVSDDLPDIRKRMYDYYKPIVEMHEKEVKQMQVRLGNILTLKAKKL